MPWVPPEILLCWLAKLELRECPVLNTSSGLDRFSSNPSWSPPKNKHSQVSTINLESPKYLTKQSIQNHHKILCIFNTIVKHFFTCLHFPNFRDFYCRCVTQCCRCAVGVLLRSYQSCSQRVCFWPIGECCHRGPVQSGQQCPLPCGPAAERGPAQPWQWS